MFVILRSPGKLDRQVSVRAPTSLEILLGARNLPDPDSSWDVGVVVSDPREPVVVKRPRPGSRPQARKTLIEKLLQDQAHTAAETDAKFQAAQATMEQKLEAAIEMMSAAHDARIAACHAEVAKEQEERKAAMEMMSAAHDARIAACHAEVVQERAERNAAEKTLMKWSARVHKKLIAEMKSTIQELDVVEAHESLSRCLQGYNDEIFNTRRIAGLGPRQNVLKNNQKSILKENGCDYITRLWDVSAQRLNKNPAFNNALAAALQILSIDEQNLCQALSLVFARGVKERNEIQYPKPDATTAFKRTLVATKLPPNLQQVLRDFLKTDPSRMRLWNETDVPEEALKLFAPAGTYVSVQRKRKELAAMEKAWREIKEQLAARKEEDAEEDDDEDDDEEEDEEDEKEDEKEEEDDAYEKARSQKRRHT
ncbi:hypothetical protein B0H12DRAFT_362299 [Mycena haematopus]|nr:hypothetical protein B0H12DRAFT_362299 [Mycena haematopus]